MAEKKKDASKARPSRNPRTAPPDYGYLNPSWQGPDTDHMTAIRGAYPEFLATDEINRNGHPVEDYMQPGPRMELAARTALRARRPPNVEENPWLAIAATSAGMTTAKEAAQQLQKFPPPKTLTPYPVAAQQKQRKRRNDMALQREITQQQSVPQTSLRAVLWGQ